MTTKNEVTRINQEVIINGLNQGQIALITQETPGHLIRRRKGRGGKAFDYVPHNFVTELLNQAFQHAWSFECNPILPLCNENELTVKGKLIVHGQDGRQIIKEQFGQQDILKNNKGEIVMSFGDALKGAGSDALRKCASLLGIGLDLYGENHTPKQQSGQQPTNTHTHTQAPTTLVKPPRITQGQVNLIKKLIQSKVFSTEEKNKATFFADNPKNSKAKAEEFLNHIKALIKEHKQMAEETQKELEKEMEGKIYEAKMAKRDWTCKCGTTLKNTTYFEACKAGWWIHHPDIDNRKKEITCPNCQKPSDHAPMYTARNSEDFSHSKPDTQTNENAPMTEKQTVDMKRCFHFYNFTPELTEDFISHVEKSSGLNRETEAFATDFLENLGSYLDTWGRDKLPAN